MLTLYSAVIALLDPAIQYPQEAPERLWERGVWLPGKKTMVAAVVICVIAAILIYWRPLIFVTAVLAYTSWHRLLS
jgi:hypothetical protein